MSSASFYIGKNLEGSALYCAVYDGPVVWECRSAFEQIELYENTIRDAIKALSAHAPTTAIELLRDAHPDKRL